MTGLSSRNCGMSSSSDAAPRLGGLVPDAQQGVWCRLYLHAGSRAQSRRIGSTLVLHASQPVLRRASRALGHFPLQHFWGPLANIQSTTWIADSAVLAAARYQPHFFYIYLPHLDYAAQKSGPDSPAAQRALVELDDVIGRLVDGMSDAYGGRSLTWLAASEYVVTPVDHVCYPNRRLRQAGLLEVERDGAQELLDLRASIVQDEPGTTRDRLYGETDWGAAHSWSLTQAASTLPPPTKPHRRGINPPP